MVRTLTPSTPTATFWLMQNRWVFVLRSEVAKETIRAAWLRIVPTTSNSENKIPLIRYSKALEKGPFFISHHSHRRSTNTPDELKKGLLFPSYRLEKKPLVNPTMATLPRQNFPFSKQNIYLHAKSVLNSRDTHFKPKKKVSLQLKKSKAINV